MADFLLELFSEEIPARMQAQAAKNLERLVVGALSDRGLLFEGVKSFAGPRRLTLAIAGLPARQPDVKEERKGPRVNAPEKAILGFLKSAGVTIEQCQKQDDGKGEFYVAVIERKGRDTADVLTEMLPEVLTKLPWPKSMRFPGSPVRWVRPLHAIVATLDGEVVPFEFAGVKSGNVTFGHRFLSKGPIEVRRLDDYVEKLRKAHVIVDAAERKEIIRHEAQQRAFALGLELIEDDGLLEEVAGLAEWPVVLIGRIESAFMDLPPEILQTSMRAHQKYFALRHPKDGKLTNRFVIVANTVPVDGGKEIIAGNERVLRARLSDAKFFWDRDRKRTLESRVEDLKHIIFHAKLGTQLERVKRIEVLAGEIAEKIGLDKKGIEKAKRAARLCKADLTTGVVGEFPELQGVMGRYYHLEHHPDDVEVADAIRDHYKPLGPSDAVPTDKVSIAVALADKLYTLVGLWWVGEKPTGSSDPYALRRSCLGLVRIVLANGLRIRLSELLYSAFGMMPPISTGTITVQSDFETKFPNVLLPNSEGGLIHSLQPQLVEIFSFLMERIKVALREKGTRHDLIDAVFSLGNEDDLVRLVARVEALQSFLNTDDGANLLIAYRRAANILKAEEKKDGRYEGEPKLDLLKLPEEKALADALAKADKRIADNIAKEKFVEAMSVMASLRAPVDAFFDKVTVNDKDASLRKNRLLLLSRLRATLHLVADFSKIEG